MKLGDYFIGKKRLIQKDVVDSRILQYTLYPLGSQFFKCAIGSSTTHPCIGLVNRGGDLLTRTKIMQEKLRCG